MLTQVAINRETGDGKYADILDVAEHLANGDYGSATNAIAVMVRQSPLFKQAVTNLENAATSEAGSSD